MSGKIYAEKECSNCNTLKVISSTESIFSNKCPSCKSIINKNLLNYDVDSILDEYCGVKKPNVIPKQCGDCDYFKVTGWIDSYKGHCEYFEIDTWSNFGCFVNHIEKELVKYKQENDVSLILCPQCKAEQNPNALFCNKCGTEISPKQKIKILYCDICNSEYDESSLFCEKDGNKLVQKETESAGVKKKINDKPNDSKGIYNNEVSELPMKWYKFLTYFLFPFPLFVSIISLPFIDDSIIIITIIISGIFSGVTIYGLHNKTAWSWKLLILTYLINSLSFRIERFDDVGLGIYIFGIIVINVIVTYPNYIYFNKRKHLFNN